MKKRVIRNAYEAWWFLYFHPKLNRPSRHEVTAKRANEMEVKGFRIVRDRSGKCWRLWRHHHDHALDKTLEIFYCMANGKGHIEKEQSKNKFVECWLEFGPIDYGYMSYDPKTKQPQEWDTDYVELDYHDPDLDCGAHTFDEALVQLARLVLKKYGDYSDKLASTRSKRWCGKPVCADCEEVKEFRKGRG